MAPCACELQMQRDCISFIFSFFAVENIIPISNIFTPFDCSRSIIFYYEVPSNIVFGTSKHFTLRRNDVLAVVNQFWLSLTKIEKFWQIAVRRQCRNSHKMAYRAKCNRAYAAQHSSHSIDSIQAIATTFWASLQ